MAQPRRYNGLFLLLILLSVCPAGALPLNLTDAGQCGDACPIRLFVPDADSIHSVQVMDILTLPDGDTLLATASGLSRYNGSWDTRHMNRLNVSAGLLDDYVTSLEYDPQGNLWIGYGDGIQIYNGAYYRTLRDQQLFKSLRITDIQRWDNDMWVITGNAGIHRYRNGTWTWYEPMAKGGSGFYEADSLALDSADNILYIATAGEGLWAVPLPDDPVMFTRLADKNSILGTLRHVRPDTQGGVYFFNDTLVVHFDPATKFQKTIASGDLSESAPAINDLVSGQNGELYIATDDGIFIVGDGAVQRHLGRFEGIGTSPIVKWIGRDAKNRIWFATQDDVGYYSGFMGELMPIDTVAQPGSSTPPPTATPKPAGTVPPVNISLPGNATAAAQKPPLDALLDYLARLVKTINPVG